MLGFENTIIILLAQMQQAQETPSEVGKYILAGVVFLVVCIAIWFTIRNFTAGETYDLEGQYGGGRGLKTIYRHKRLKRIDRMGLLRGKSRQFVDPELDKLLSDDKLSDAAAYLTGILNAAKEAGDDYARVKYARYSDEVIRRYENLEDKEHGGKAWHFQK